MSSLAIAGLIFACILVAGIVGMAVSRMLPPAHLSGESKDVVKLALGIVATMTALVLGLLVASAKGTFDAQNNSVKDLSARIVLLDRLLVRYGPETKEARALLKDSVAIMVANLWPDDAAQKATLTPGAAMSKMEAFYDKIGELSPQNDAQRGIRSQILSLTADLAQTRLRLAAQKDSSIPVPFLVVLGLWLAVLFVGYGLMAPHNATVGAALIICALSITMALFLILELDRPFDGIVRVSSVPMREALETIGK